MAPCTVVAGRLSVLDSRDGVERGALLLLAPGICTRAHDDVRRSRPVPPVVLASVSLLAAACACTRSARDCAPDPSSAAMIVIWLALLLLSGCCGAPTVAAVRKAWLEVKLPPDARATALLNEMTLSEKVDMVHGHPSGPGLAQNCSWGSVNTTRTCVRTLCFSSPPSPVPAVPPPGPLCTVL